MSKHTFLEKYLQPEIIEQPVLPTAYKRTTRTPRANKGY
jgi:hypothetical protein